MDKRLLDALENLSLALEEIAMSLDDANKAKAKTNVGSALTSGNLDSKVELINKGVKQLLDDNKKIIKNQETLISMAKDKKDKNIFSDSGDKTNQEKIKDGLGIILAIAFGVLAIGLAFKIIGTVNFASVIALAIALPILAIAYGIIAKQDSSKVNDVIAISRGMAWAILVSSFFLSFVQPMSVAQLMTTIFIAGALVILSYSLAKITDGLSTMKFGSALKLGYLVLIFSALSLAIAISSEILNMVVPVSFFKLFTAVLIATAFVALSYGLKNIVDSLSGIGLRQLGTIIILPIILLALSFAIALSSQVLGLVKPIGLMQLFTAVLIAGVFVGLSYGLKNIIKAMEGVDVTKIPMMVWVLPLLFVAMSAAIALSSPFLAKTVVIGFFVLLCAALISLTFIPMAYSAKMIAGVIKEIDAKDLWKIPIIMIAMATSVMLVSWIFAMAAPVSLITTLQMGFLAVVMAGIAFVLAKLYGTSFGKLQPQEVVKNGIILVLMAATIAAASLVLSIGSYDNYPGLWWVINVAVALTVFGLAVVIVGMAIQILGQRTFVTGAAAVVILAIAISVTSLALSMGRYDANSYPGIFWTIGVGATLVLFSILALALGAVFGGPLAIVGLVGLSVMGVLALGIVGVSLILSMGRYGEYPTFDWNLGVLGSLLAWGAAAVTLGFGSILIATVGVLGVGVMLGLAGTIAAVSLILAKGDYSQSGSMLEWTKATVLIYGAFIPLLLIAGALSLASGLTQIITLGTVNPIKKASNMILSIADLIVNVSKRLSGGNFTTGPTKEWAEGIALALGAFSQVYGMLAASRKWFFAGPTMEEYKNAIITIADGITTAADKFASFSVKAYPTKQWAEGVGEAIRAFAPVYGMLNESRGWFGTGGPTVEEYRNAITTIASGISAAADSFSNFAEKPYPSDGWARGVGGAIKAFAPVYEILAKNQSIWGGPSAEQYVEAIKTILNGILYAADFFKNNIGSFNIENVPPIRWSSAVGSAIKAFAPVFEFVSKNTGWYDGANLIKRAIKVTADSLKYVAKVFSKITFPGNVDSESIKNMASGIREYANLVGKEIGPKRKMISKGLYMTVEVVKNMGWASWWFLGVIKNLKPYDQMSLKQMIAGIRDYVILTADIIGQRKNKLNRSVLNLTYDVVTAMGRMAWNFSSVSQNMKSFDKDWMTAATTSIKAYVELALWLNGKDVSYSKIASAVSNMEKMAKGYSRYADGLKKINQEVEKIDIKKLNALKSFTGSVVLMSLMDSEQFNKMMDALEEKTSIFVDVINDLESKSDNKSKASGTKMTGVKSPEAKDSQRNINDLFDVMSAIDSKMGAIVGYNSEFSSYISEIRTGDLQIKNSGSSNNW